MAFYVYILASRRNGTLYIGMTDNLIQRVWMHRSGTLPGFTKRYGVKMLVWYEQHDTRASALTRERPDEEMESILEDSGDRAIKSTMVRSL